MLQSSMAADMVVYILIATVFIAAIFLPYPKFNWKNKKNNESNRGSQK